MLRKKEATILKFYFQKHQQNKILYTTYDELIDNNFDLQVVEYLINLEYLDYVAHPNTGNIFHHTRISPEGQLALYEYNNKPKFHFKLFNGIRDIIWLAIGAVISSIVTFLISKYLS